MKAIRLAIVAATAMLGSDAYAQLPAWLQQGERLTFTMAWLGITGGTLTLEADQPAGESTFRLVMRARSTGFVSRIFEVDDLMETRIDPVRVTTVLSTKNNREGKHRLEERVVFDPAAGTARRWKNGTEREPLAAPTPIMDTLGAMYYLRTLPLAPGKRFEFSVQSGNKVYPMRVTVRERKRVKTVLGPTDILVVDPAFADGGLLNPKGKNLIWVTAEPPHTLIKITSELPFGALTATLAAVERPWGVIQSSSGQGGGGKE